MENELFLIIVALPRTQNRVDRHAEDNFGWNVSSRGEEKKFFRVMLGRRGGPIITLHFPNIQH